MSSFRIDVKERGIILLKKQKGIQGKTKDVTTQL
jgi:hypothetical protein